jgi:hypothetical protein
MDPDRRETGASQTCGVGQRIRLMEKCNVPDKYCRFRRSTHYIDTSVTLEILRPAAAWVSVLVNVSHDLLVRQA